MLWGCFLAAGPGRLVKEEGKMNAVKHRKILKELRLRTTFDFKLDNNPKHLAKTPQKWFKSNNFNVLEWLSQSPDLYPIENLWLDMKRAVHS